MVVKEGVVSYPCGTDVLYPAHGGNIHAFTAVTHCAVLDVLAPPYEPMSGRNCTFYGISENEGQPRSGEGHSFL